MREQGMFDPARLVFIDETAVSTNLVRLSCRSCRPHSPFAELVRLSRTSIADEIRIEHTRRVFNE